MKFLKETLKKDSYSYAYDLEIDHKDHNFLIGEEHPIITSNSHSISYAHNAFLCAYFATYYPIEWYASLLKNEKTADFVPIILDQIKKLNLNINIKSPKLNFSKHEPTIVGNDIILGCDTILGVGEKASIELMNLPFYNNFEEFDESKEYSKRAVNKGVVEGLIMSGFFDDTDNDRIELLYNYIISKTKKKEIKEKGINFDNFIEKIYDYHHGKEMFMFDKEMQKLGFPLREFPKQRRVNEIWDNIQDELNENIEYDIIYDFDKILKKTSKNGNTYYSILMKNIKGELFWINIFGNGSEYLSNNFDVNLDIPETYKGKYFMLIYEQKGNNKDYKIMLTLE